MCWVMPPASPATTLALRMRSSSLVLPWSTWPMTVMTGGRGSASSPSSSSSQLVEAELALQLDLLLLAGVDEADLGADLGGEQLDHVVGERLGGRDHLALLQRKRTTSAAVRLSLGPRSCGVEARSTTIAPSGTGADAGV